MLVNVGKNYSEPLIEKKNNDIFKTFLFLTFPFYFLLFAVCRTNGPLGMITGSIKDWQITASSTYPHEWDKKCNEKYARVYLPNKYGWCAKYKSPSEWLQVDLGVAARVSRFKIFIVTVFLWLQKRLSVTFFVPLSLCPSVLLLKPISR